MAKSTTDLSFGGQPHTPCLARHCIISQRDLSKPLLSRSIGGNWSAKSAWVLLIARTLARQIQLATTPLPSQAQAQAPTNKAHAP